MGLILFHSSNPILSQQDELILGLITRFYNKPVSVIKQGSVVTDYMYSKTLILIIGQDATTFNFELDINKFTNLKSLISFNKLASVSLLKLATSTNTTVSASTSIQDALMKKFVEPFGFIYTDNNVSKVNELVGFSTGDSFLCCNNFNKTNPFVVCRLSGQTNLVHIGITDFTKLSDYGYRVLNSILLAYGNKLSLISIKSINSCEEFEFPPIPQSSVFPVLSWVEVTPIGSSVDVKVLYDTAWVSVYSGVDLSHFIGKPEPVKVKICLSKSTDGEPPYVTEFKMSYRLQVLDEVAIVERRL